MIEEQSWLISAKCDEIMMTEKGRKARCLSSCVTAALPALLYDSPPLLANHRLGDRDRVRDWDRD